MTYITTQDDGMAQQPYCRCVGSGEYTSVVNIPLLAGGYLGSRAPLLRAPAASPLENKFASASGYARCYHPLKMRENQSLIE